MDLSDTAVINVRGKQLDRLFVSSRLDLLVGVAATMAAAFDCIGKVQPGLVTTWSVVTIVSYGVRFLIGRAFKKTIVATDNLTRWSNLHIGGAAVSGLCWGALNAFILFTFDFSVAAATLLLACGIVLMSVGAHAGSVPSTWATIATALLPPIVVLVSAMNAPSLAVASSLLIVAGAATICTKTLRAQIWEAALLQGEHEQLISHLDQRRTQVEKLNVAIKTTQSKREQAEVNLRRTAADLGLVQGKAKALAETLERISPLCQVTGLSNRRHFDQHLDAEWRRATREETPLSIVVVDMDEYEAYVDSYGRQSADTLLKRVGQTVKGFGRRAGDLAGRYDESKIGLLLPGCDARNAGRLAEALRKRIESLKIPHANAQSREVMTVHVGVATTKPSRSMRSDELLKRVDAALYEARFQGGNKVVVYQPLSKLRIERWDIPNDGPLNEQSLLQKLLVWGYDTEKSVLKPGTSLVTESRPTDTVISILNGDLLIEVEGHTLTIRPGDSVFIPSGIETRLQTLGDKPVYKFTANKNK